MNLSDLFENTPDPLFVFKTKDRKTIRAPSKERAEQLAMEFGFGPIKGDGRPQPRPKDRGFNNRCR